MKTNLLKYFFLAICLCSNFVMLAQVPGNNDDGGGLEGTDDPPATPIDDYVWVLVVIGLVFAFIRFKALFLDKNRSPNS